MVRHEAALDQVSGPDGLKTGYLLLDAALDVIVRGELCIIAGPPAGGKTTLALNVALNNAGTKTIWVTPDESHGFLVKKLVCAEFNVTQQQLLAFRKGNKKKVSAFLEDADAWLQVTDESSPTRLEAVITDAVKEWDGERPELLVFDYVKLLDSGSRWSDVAQKIGWLKAFAKAAQIHVVVVHQALKASINPVYIDRLGQKQALVPQLQDLSEAGPAEAFQVLWMRRTPILSDDDMRREKRQPSAECWILKNKIQSDLPLEPFRFALTPRRSDEGDEVNEEIDPASPLLRMEVAENLRHACADALMLLAEREGAIRALGATLAERNEEIDRLLVEAVVLREKQERHDAVTAEMEKQLAWTRLEIQRLTEMTRKWWKK